MEQEAKERISLSEKYGFAYRLEDKYRYLIYIN